MSRVLLAVVLGAALSGCADDLTQIVVSITTNLDVPDEMDQLDVRADGFSATVASKQLRASFAQETLTLVHDGGELGPLQVVVTGRKDGTPVIEYRARTEFVREQARQLKVDLQRACLGLTSCVPSMTCRLGNCVETPRVDLTLPPQAQGDVPSAGVSAGSSAPAGSGGTGTAGSAGSTGGAAGASPAPECPSGLQCVRDPFSGRSSCVLSTGGYPLCDPAVGCEGSASCEPFGLLGSVCVTYCD